MPPCPNKDSTRYRRPKELPGWIEDCEAELESGEMPCVANCDPSGGGVMTPVSACLRLAAAGTVAPAGLFIATDCVWPDPSNPTPHCPQIRRFSELLAPQLTQTIAGFLSLVCRYCLTFF